MTRDALIRSLALAPDILEGFLALLDDGALDRDRGSGLWTIREHLVHLAEVQPMLHGRIETFRDRTRPTMVPHDPAEEDREARVGAGADAALDRFRTWRERQVELLDSLDEAVWAKEGDHPEYARYSLDILASHIHFHDGFHLYRMEETAWVTDGNLTVLP